MWALPAPGRGAWVAASATARADMRQTTPPRAARPWSSVAPTRKARRRFPKASIYASVNGTGLEPACGGERRCAREYAHSLGRVLPGEALLDRRRDVLVQRPPHVIRPRRVIEHEHAQLECVAVPRDARRPEQGQRLGCRMLRPVLDPRLHRQDAECPRRP